MNNDNIQLENAFSKLDNNKDTYTIESFCNEIKEINPANLNDINFINLNRTLAILYRNKGDLNEAINYFEKAIRKMESNSFCPPLREDYYGHLFDTYSILAESYAIQSNYIKAEQCYDKLIYYYFCYNYRNNNGKNNPIYYLYQYRNIDKFLLQDLIQNKITLNAVKNFNDPFDSLVYHWLNQRLNNNEEEKIVSSMKKSFTKFRIACFSGNYCKNVRFAKNLLMWSHYADAHKGICICYKINKSFFNKFIVDCNNEFLTIGAIKYNKKHTLLQREPIDFNQSFLIKHKKWVYEKEVRLLYFNSNNTKDYISLEMETDVSIEQIYFGYKCSEQDKKTIKQLFPGICKEAKIDYSENKDIYTSIKFYDAK